MIDGGSTYNKKVFQACSRSKESSAIPVNSVCLGIESEVVGRTASRLLLFTCSDGNQTKNGRKGFLTQMGRARGCT